MANCCVHSIHRGLESNDQVEVEAAIYATSCLCKHSATFASSVCEKIAGMVQGEEVLYKTHILLGTRELLEYQYCYLG